MYEGKMNKFGVVKGDVDTRSAAETGGATQATEGAAGAAGEQGLVPYDGDDEEVGARIKHLMAATEAAELELTRERWKYKELEKRATDMVEYGEQLQKQHFMERTEWQVAINARDEQIGLLKAEVAQKTRELHYAHGKVDEFQRKGTEGQLGKEEAEHALKRREANLKSLQDTNVLLIEEKGKLMEEIEELHSARHSLEQAHKKELAAMETYLRAEVAREQKGRDDALQECKLLAAERDRMEATRHAALLSTSDQQERLELAYREIEALTLKCIRLESEPTSELNEAHRDLEKHKLQVKKLRRELKEEQERVAELKTQAKVLNTTLDDTRLKQDTLKGPMMQEVAQLRDQMKSKNTELEHMSWTIKNLKVTLEEAIFAKAESLKESAKLRASNHEFSETLKSRDEDITAYKKKLIQMATDGDVLRMRENQAEKAQAAGDVQQLLFQARANQAHYAPRPDAYGQPQ